MSKKVYFDYASTTYVSSEVLNEMLPCYSAIYGNSNSLHSYGREAASIVDRARDRIKNAIGAEKSNEIYFTSGGTEANNWAIRGIAHAYSAKGKHIIVSKIEHKSILDTCASLVEEGFKVDYVNVDQNGLVNMSELLHLIRRDTILNIKAIAKVAHDFGVLFHTDAVQAMGALKLDVKDMEIDLMTISGHKIYGPKGVGALYIRDGVRIENLVYGGSQERGKRGGTVDVPAVAGFGKAVEIANRDIVVNQQKLKTIREYFLKNVRERIEYVELNGHPHQKVNGIVNLCFEMVDKESLLMLLDLEGVAVSAGSACTANSTTQSHVLKAMGFEDERTNSSIRFSFGKNTTKADVDYAIEVLVNSVEKLRSISALTKAGRK